VSLMDRLYACLPLGEDTPREWPLFDEAERRCVEAGYEVRFSPDSRTVSVDLVRAGDRVGDVLISLSALEEMPRDVADYTLATMTVELLDLAEYRRGGSVCHAAAFCRTRRELADDVAVEYSPPEACESDDSRDWWIVNYPTGARDIITLTGFCPWCGARLAVPS